MLKKAILVLASASFSAQAQTPPGDAAARPVNIQTGVTMEATASDNFNLAPESTKESGRAVELSPYLRAALRTERSRGDLSLRLRGLWYSSGDNDGTKLSPDLRTNGDLSLSGDRLRVAGSAYVFRTSPSPFGNSSLDPAAVNVESEWYKSVAVSPYSLGRIGNADYELRYKAQMIDPGIASRSTENQVSAGLSSNRGGSSRLGWSAYGDTSKVDFEDGLDFTRSTVEALGYFSVTPLLRVGAGVNYSRISILYDEDGDNSGIGPVAFISWQPDPRTSLTGKYTDAYYGSFTQVNLAHRSVRWMAGLKYSRGLQTGNQSGLLYFNPEEVFALAGARAGTGAGSAAGAGTGAGAGAGAGAGDQMLQGMADRRLVAGAGQALLLGQTSNELTYAQSLIASFAILRPRNGAFLTVFSNEQKPAVAGTGTEQVTSLDQRGFNLSLNHRLTPRNTLFVLGQFQVSKSSDSGQKSRLDTYVGGLNTSLSRQISTSLALRAARQRSTGDVPTAEYKERAIIASIDYRF
jgi:uncharacterized protein (PEP-CTERM system associated)